MTILVYRNNVLAADRQVTDTGSNRKYEWQKIHMLDDALVGISGDMFRGVTFLKLYRSGIRKDFANVPDAWLQGLDEEIDFEAIIIKEKSIKIYNQLLVPLDISDVSYYAMGSGADVAYGALYMGATAEEAVKAAIAVDTQSGFGAVTFKREDIPATHRAKQKQERAKKRNKTISTNRS